MGNGGIWGRVWGEVGTGGGLEWKGKGEWRGGGRKNEYWQGGEGDLGGGLEILMVMM